MAVLSSIFKKAWQAQFLGHTLVHKTKIFIFSRWTNDIITTFWYALWFLTWKNPSRVSFPGFSLLWLTWKGKCYYPIPYPHHRYTILILFPHISCCTYSAVQWGINNPLYLKQNRNSLALKIILFENKHYTCCSSGCESVSNQSQKKSVAHLSSITA